MRGWEKFSKEEALHIRSKGGITLKKKYSSGELLSPFKGKKHSEETKEKIRKKRIEYLKDNKKNTAWYHKGKRKMSYGEKFIHTVFLKEKIYEKYDIINEFCEYPYFIDFAFINEKVAVEFDGAVHFNNGEKRIEHDIERDNYLTSIGWRMYRLPYFEINSFNINDLINFIGNSKTKNFEDNLITYKQFKLKKRKEDLLKKEEKTKQKTKQIDTIKHTIINSNIDFSKFGWVNEASKIIGVTPQKVGKWMKRKMPEFYEKCFKRKNKQQQIS